MLSSINELINIRVALLSCGIIASVIYGASDIILGLTLSDYRFDAQSASVLNAFGTSTRPVMVVTNLIAGILLFIFSLGIWITSEQDWQMRLVAIMISGNAIFSMVASTFFPMHLDQPMNSSANKMNVILMFLSVFFYLLAIITGVFANHNWFRYVSLGIILLYIVLFILGTVIGKNRLTVFGEHGPLVGIQERTMIYTWQIWLILQAVVLM